MPSSTAEQLERARRRATRLFLSAVALGNTAMVAAMTVTTLVAERVTGAATWSGIPLAAAVLGIAVGTALLPRVMQRWGRRPGLVAGYVTAALGAALAIGATSMSSFVLLVVGLLVLGTGQSAGTLTRYLSADLQPPWRRASAISLVVWMGTVGAVLGPNLLAPSGSFAATLGLDALAGAYLVALLAFAVAATLHWIWLRPDPADLVFDRDQTSGSGPAQPVGIRRHFAEPTLQVALLSLVGGHVVMVLIMSMTPLHLQHAGAGLGSIGLIASAHTLGMFAFSPLVGRLVDRRGAPFTIALSLMTLASAALIAGLSPSDSRGVLLLALFLLGLGWNFGFVAGSTLLASGIAPQDRSRVQGLADSLVWTSAAVASLLAGLILSAVGYRGLCATGGLLVVVAALLVAHRHRAMSRQGEPARDQETVGEIL